MINYKAIIVAIIVAAIAFSSGYVFHLKLTDPIAAEELLGGDINRTAAHDEILDPEADAALLKMRMNEFLLVSEWAVDYAKQFEDEAFKEPIKALNSTRKASVKALKDPEAAYEQLSAQIDAIAPFVAACDARIASFPEKDLKLASLRDLMVSFSIQNAYLVNDVEQIEMLTAMTEQIAYEDMVYNLGE